MRFDFKTSNRQAAFIGGSMLLTGAVLYLLAYAFQPSRLRDDDTAVKVAICAALGVGLIAGSLTYASERDDQQRGFDVLPKEPDPIRDNLPPR